MQIAAVSIEAVTLHEGGAEVDDREVEALQRRLHGRAASLVRRGEVCAEDVADGVLCLNGKDQLNALPPLATWPVHTLNLRDCRKLTQLPVLPDALEVLNLDMCYLLGTLPPWPLGLKALLVMCCRPHDGHTSHRRLLPPLPAGLRLLELTGCNGLDELPLPPALHTLRIWGAGPKQLPTLPARLRRLELSGLSQQHTLPPLPDTLAVLHVSEGAEPTLRSLGPLPTSLRELVLKGSPKLELIKGQLPPQLQFLKLEAGGLRLLPTIPRAMCGVLDLRQLSALQAPPDLGPIPHHVVISTTPPGLPTERALATGLCYGRDVCGDLQPLSPQLRVLLPRHLQPAQPRCCGCFRLYPESKRTIKEALSTMCCGPLFPLIWCAYVALLSGQQCLAPCGGYPCCPLPDD